LIEQPFYYLTTLSLSFFIALYYFFSLYLI